MNDTQSILAGLTAVGDSCGHFSPTVVPSLNQFTYELFGFSEKNRSAKRACKTFIRGFDFHPHRHSNSVSIS